MEAGWDVCRLIDFTPRPQCHSGKCKDDVETFLFQHKDGAAASMLNLQQPLSPALVVSEDSCEGTPSYYRSPLTPSC